MTQSDEESTVIVGMRLAKAEQFINDAFTLITHGSALSALNRCYYAMFQAATALAIRDHCTFHKHQAVISWFPQNYIKTGRLPRDSGKALQKAFTNRCDADYEDVVAFPIEEAAELLEQARQFVDRVKSLLRADG
jgi:uncharacterized protein (UPF0332 family)